MKTTTTANKTKETALTNEQIVKLNPFLLAKTGSSSNIWKNETTRKQNRKILIQTLRANNLKNSEEVQNFLEKNWEFIKDWFIANANSIQVANMQSVKNFLKEL